MHFVLSEKGVELDYSLLPEEYVFPIKEFYEKYQSKLETGDISHPLYMGLDLYDADNRGHFIIGGGSLSPKVEYGQILNKDMYYDEIVEILFNEEDRALWRRDRNGNTLSEEKLQEELKRQEAAKERFLIWPSVLDVDGKSDVFDVFVDIYYQIIDNMHKDYQSRIYYQKAFIAASAIAYYRLEEDVDRKERLSLDLINQISEVLIMT